jgi:hypothetical protein
MRDWASSGLDNNYRLPAIIEVASKDRARTEEDTSGAEELTANHFLNWVYQSYTYGALPGSGIDTFDPAGDDREKRITAYWLGIEAELSITTVGPGPGIAEWIAASDPDGECF